MLAGYQGGTYQTLGSVSVRLTGKVINASTMTGTVQLTGVPCSTPAYTYTAKIDPSQTKYIAPNA